jgi:acetyltransferase-like isoleucine patch superfamily enzyme
LGQQYTDEKTKRKFSLPDSVSICRVSLDGHVVIGERTYINEGSRVDSGPKTSVKIGKHCAIGRYVHITAKTHDLHQPTTDETHGEIPNLELDVNIGDFVWIGDKVTILPGVTIGNFAVIAAHAVVNEDVKDFEMVGGIPAKHIRFNSSHYLFPTKGN